MTRLYIVVEGQTEEAFVNKLLAPFLLRNQIYAYARLVGTKGHRGGVISYQDSEI